MKRNTLYIIFSALAALTIFLTAATCSFCGMELDTENSGGEPPMQSEDLSPSPESISTSQNEPHADNQESDTDIESQEEINNPPSIREVEIMGTDIEMFADQLEFIPSAELEELEILFTIEAYDDDGDELAYSAYDSLGIYFDVTKIDNNNAEFIWRNPELSGSYTLTVEVSDGMGGSDILPINMNIINEPSGQIENNPPEISEIRISNPDSGNIITANYVYTSEEYELLAIASDPEGDALHYQWSIEAESGGYIGDISDIYSNPTTWSTPVQGEDVIDLWCIITIKVGDNWNELQSFQRRVHIVTGSGI